jgi:hypothetical protein
MQLERGNILQRLWTMLRLIGAAIFHRTPQMRESRLPLPGGWKSVPQPTWPAVKLSDLRRVIPIVQTQTAAGIAVTLISLESYENGFLVHGDFSEKYGERNAENFWVGHPAFVATDDTGTDYRWWPSSGHDGRFKSGFAPALHPNARELRLTVTHVQWTFFKKRRRELDEGPWSFRISLD